MEVLRYKCGNEKTGADILKIAHGFYNLLTTLFRANFFVKLQLGVCLSVLCEDRSFTMFRVDIWKLIGATNVFYFPSC